ncbi:MAG: hypothetical protein LRY66_13760 [Saccharospirillaceae bacterium]|nr:hypothetical protein [Saccharospirillaceae bacterium]MCD8532375.1 hypothetical protein [Saccharospirillaceae bacterium]
MPMKVISAISQPVKEKLANADHRELTSSGFWIGHLLMIAATIAGVYLAAQAGLQQAILFNDITSKETNYYLRQSLHDEVSINVKILRQYNEDYFGRGISVQELKQNNPKISRYVWEAMKFSPNTLETPSYFLSEIQNFYRNVDDLIEKREKFTYGPTHASKLLVEQLDRMEKTVLPKLAANGEKLAADLLVHNVDVRAYKEPAGE